MIVTKYSHDGCVIMSTANTSLSPTDRIRVRLCASYHRQFLRRRRRRTLSTWLRDGAAEVLQRAG